MDELKREWKRAAKLNHPDMGGSTRRMQRLNDEYDRYRDLLDS